MCSQINGNILISLVAYALLILPVLLQHFDSLRTQTKYFRERGKGFRVKCFSKLSVKTCWLSVTCSVLQEYSVPVYFLQLLKTRVGLRGKTQDFQTEGQTGIIPQGLLEIS